MSEADTGRAWGIITSDGFRPLPKQPMLIAGLGPPPFDVKLPSGDVRHIVEEPEQETS